MKLQLKNITLVIIDCINLERAKIALDICEKNIEFGEVKLLTHFKEGDERIVNIDKIDSVKKYSTFCIKNLNDYINTKYCLVIQYDGFVLNPEKWSDEFLKYDYIGCADIKRDESVVTEDDDRMVGNGGFSLRSKKLLNILQQISVKEEDFNFGEDYIISYLYRDLLKEKGIRFAQKDIADIFSTNTANHDIKSENIQSFGFHGTKINLDSFLDINPEFINIKKYLKKEVGTLKVLYFKTFSFFSKIPILNKLLHKILLFVKKIYYKYIY